MRVKTITLAVEHWQKLLEAASEYEDCGLADEGWQSPELVEAVASLAAALEASQEEDLSSLNNQPD